MRYFTFTIRIYYYNHKVRCFVLFNYDFKWIYLKMHLDDKNYEMIVCHNYQRYLHTVHARVNHNVKSSDNGYEILCFLMLGLGVNIRWP